MWLCPFSSPPKGTLMHDTQRPYSSLFQALCAAVPFLSPVLLHWPELTNGRLSVPWFCVSVWSVLFVPPLALLHWAASIYHNCSLSISIISWVWSMVVLLPLFLFKLSWKEGRNGILSVVTNHRVLDVFIVLLPLCLGNHSEWYGVHVVFRSGER